MQIHIEAPRFKIIDGIRWHYEGSRRTKNDAKEFSATIRTGSKTTCIIKTGPTEWSVYSRLAKKYKMSS